MFGERWVLREVFIFFNTMKEVFLFLMEGSSLNDYDYLINEEEFYISLLDNLKSVCEEEKIMAFIYHLHSWSNDQLQNKRYAATLDVDSYAPHELLPFSGENRKSVKIVLFSCILREYILRADSTPKRTEYWRDRYLTEIHSALSFTTETETLEFEMIYLARHFCTISYLSKILSGSNHKEIFLTVGYSLECSGKYHGSGGHAGEPRIRRVHIFENVTGVKPRIRRKSSECELSRSRSASISASSFERIGFTPVDYVSEGMVTPVTKYFSSSLAIRTPSTTTISTTIPTVSSSSSSVFTVPSYDQRDERYSSGGSYTLSEDRSPIRTLIRTLRMSDFIATGNSSTSESDNSNRKKRCSWISIPFQPPFPYQELQFQANSNCQEAAFESPVYRDEFFEDYVKIMLSDSDKDDELNDECQHF
jgi:hypothetical protein